MPPHVAPAVLSWDAMSEHTIPPALATGSMLSAPPEQPARRPALIVDGLRVGTTFGADIVDEVSFTVQAGEVLCLVGESGCGKTSTALALLGHARPGTRIAAGAVMLDGRDLLTLPSSGMRRLRGARISYVPQDPTASLNPRHRVGA